MEGQSRSGICSVTPVRSSVTLSQRGFIPRAPRWADHSLSSMTLNLSIAPSATAYDFCASRVGRCVKRKLRPESTDPSLLSPTSATPCPSSEGGSMTIAKGPVSIFTSPASMSRLNVAKNRRREPAGFESASNQTPTHLRALRSAKE
jgi:hypothetical protein